MREKKWVHLRGAAPECLSWEEKGEVSAQFC